MPNDHKIIGKHMRGAYLEIDDEKQEKFWEYLAIMTDYEATDEEKILASHNLLELISEKV